MRNHPPLAGTRARPRSRSRPLPRLELTKLEIATLTAHGRSTLKHEQREATHIWWALPPRFKRSP